MSSVSTMVEKAYQQCMIPDCGATYALDEVLFACRQCGALLDVRYDWSKCDMPKSLSFSDLRRAGAGCKPITHKQPKLVAALDAAANDLFGIHISLSGSRALVGVWGDDCAAGADCGSAYIFDLPPAGVPTVSEWGLAAMTLLVLTGGTVVIRRRRPSAA